MITLAAPSPLLQELRAALWRDDLESAAILLCVPVQLSDSGDWRLLLREVHVAPDSAYEERTATSARLAPSFGLPIEKKARQNGWSLVYCHTHPHQRGPATFSAVDDRAEIALSTYANGRNPHAPHVALLFSAEAARARRLGTLDPVRVVEIGTRIETVFDARESEPPTAIFDRQVRAFGRNSQIRVQLAKVAIVGLGGTGSLVAQQLAHLGVREFTLVDRDNLEVTNLNRTVGATLVDVGKSKAAIAARMISSIVPNARVTALDVDVLTEGVGRQLAAADVIFCCTDSHASRHLLNQLAYQYLVPVIDLGVAIDARQPQTATPSVQFAGHVKALAPGMPCLWCLDHLDPRQVRDEMMSPEHRNADPYFAAGGGEPQPAVISINATVASLAVTMLLAMIADVPAPARFLIYDGARSRVSSVRAQANPTCNFCSGTSTALAGDTAPLPERREPRKHTS